MELWKYGNFPRELTANGWKQRGLTEASMGLLFGKMKMWQTTEVGKNAWVSSGRTFGEIEILQSNYEVRLSGRSVILTATEYRLLCFLVEREGCFQGRQTLLDGVWGRGVALEPRAVDAQIQGLRAKLGAAGSYIETIRGGGYRVVSVSGQ